MTHNSSLITFAHRGGMAHFAENSLEAFRHAIVSNVRGLETDVQLSADGVPLLAHDAKTSSLLPWRRRRLSDLRAENAIDLVPTLAQLYELAGNRFEVSIDVKSSDAVKAVVDVARTASATKQLWLAHGGYDYSDWRLVASWRSLSDDIHLIDSTSVGRFDLTPEGYVERAASAGIQVINLPGDEWSPRLIETVKNAGLLAFAFGVQKLPVMKRLSAFGIDGLYSDHIDRLVRLTASDSTEL